MLRPTLRQEQALWRAGYNVVAGVDEVGRGAWAGPIVAGAVLLTPKFLTAIKPLPWFGKVNDSKLLSPTMRGRIFNGLRHKIPWAVGVVSSQQIDAMGIAVANKLAVTLAVKNLRKRPDFVLVDYVAKLGGEVAGVPARVLVDGDARVFAIALASIVAKVHRDKLMVDYAQKYPGYDFAQHKGYGTQEHRRCLASLGPCPAHRRSYRPVASALV